jgi:hypothetical protein
MIIYLLTNVDDKFIMIKLFMFWFYITMSKIELNVYFIERGNFVIQPTLVTNLS